MLDKELYKEIKNLQDSYSFTRVGHHVLDYALDTLRLIDESVSEDDDVEEG